MIAYTKPGQLQVTCGTTMLAFAQEVTFNFLLLYKALLHITPLHSIVFNNVIHTYCIPSPLFLWTGAAITAAITRSGVLSFFTDGRQVDWQFRKGLRDQKLWLGHGWPPLTSSGWLHCITNNRKITLYQSIQYTT